MVVKVSYKSFAEALHQHSQANQAQQFLQSRSRFDTAKGYLKLYNLLCKELEEGENPFLLEYFLADCIALKSLNYWQYMIVSSIYSGKKYSEYDIKEYYLKNYNCSKDQEKNTVRMILELQKKYLKSEAEQQETQVIQKLQNRAEQLRQEVSELEECKQNLKQELQRQRQEGNSANQKWLEQERSRMMEELNWELQSRRADNLRQLENEKERQMKLLLDDPEKALAEKNRKEERECYDVQVEEMIRTRNQRIDEAVDGMREVSGTFRECADESIGALKQTLNEAFQQFQTNMEKDTAKSISRVVALERDLRVRDFKDLLEGYQRLEKQVYYRRMDCGEESKEYRTYWKKVDAFLRSFLRTLSKLGFRRLDVKEGDPFDERRMKLLDDEEKQPQEIENPQDYVVEQMIADGFSEYISEEESEHICTKAIVIVRKRGVTDGNWI